MNNLHKTLEDVKDQETFLIFVRALNTDFEQQKIQVGTEAEIEGDWANTDISSFLEGAAAWAEDSDFGSRLNPELVENYWKRFATFLYSGKVYE